MSKRNKTKPISIFKKSFAIILIIFLILNMLLFATNFFNQTLFWINLGMLASISYLFYKNKNDR